MIREQHKTLGVYSVAKPSFFPSRGLRQGSFQAKPIWLHVVFKRPEISDVSIRLRIDCTTRDVYNDGLPFLDPVCGEKPDYYPP